MKAYQHFLQQINELSARLHEHYAAHLVCRAGCSGCCHHHLSVFPVEAESIANAITALPPAVQLRVAQQAREVIKQELQGETVACPLLVQDQCAIYEARPVICRTQGLPLLFEAEDGASEVDFCPLNFTKPNALDDLSEEKLVPLDDINVQLALLNLQHCRRQSISDEQSGIRLTMSEIILRAVNETLSEVTAKNAVSEILTAWERGEGPPRAAVSLLCEMATSADEVMQKAGIASLFPQLIEVLNDSFNPSACAFYDQLFAQVISFCRQLPAANALHEKLNGFGLFDENALLVRKVRLNALPEFRERDVVRKIILLSRVTIGADVAINSVLIAALSEKCPHAEFVLLGSPKLTELFGGNRRVRVRELRYERGGGLLTRLDAWRTVLEAVATESAPLDSPDQLLIVDADSRLTQLGLLPIVANDHNYFYFESRSYRPSEAKPLSQLIAQWACEVFGASHIAVPQLALPDVYIELGQSIRRHWCAEHDLLLTVSWGVGGNARKRLDEAFEGELILNLLNGASPLPACKLVIDKGGDAVERAQIDRLLERLRTQGKTVLELNESTAAELSATKKLEADVVAWDGSIGTLAGLIAASDAYIGYDSAGQHLAAALGVATLTLFVNSNAQLFAERWRPFGNGQRAMTHVSAVEWEQGQLDRSQILQEAMSHLAEIIAPAKK